jgi:pyrimidine-specific ribonucleoside hydrolase
MIRTLLKVLLLFLVSTTLWGHPWKPNHYVIIDTDGGIDDFRAIVMMMASPDVRVLGITTSAGVLDAKEAYIKVKSLLADLNHEGVPVGINYSNTNTPKNCSEALKFKWGNNIEFPDSIPLAINLINELLSRSPEKIEFICLGSLSTFENLQKSDGFSAKKVKRLIWSSKYDYRVKNFNYELDTVSFEIVSKQKIPLFIVGGDIQGFEFDKFFTGNLKSVHNPFSIKLASGISENTKSTCSNVCFDETLVLFLHFPELFNVDSLGYLARYQVKFNNKAVIEKAFEKIISGETVNQNQVLKSFPIDSSSYFTDVQKIMAQTIDKYGKDEWVSSVLANELHRHLGVYAIIGTKMGIRAKEYFGAGVDEMKIVSYAGTIPPYSCMNDGLQVSTGGTLGHGLIRVATDSLKLPKADFFYMGRKITLTLREAYQNKIVADIKEISSIFGLDSNIYWELIRMDAINYWSNWDRHELFDVQENTN